MRALLLTSMAAAAMAYGLEPTTAGPISPLSAGNYSAVKFVQDRERHCRHRLWVCSDDRDYRHCHWACRDRDRDRDHDHDRDHDRDHDHR